MNRIEINKFMAWLIGCFPQWKPDPATTRTWADELPTITFEQAKQAIRLIESDNPSPFPPGIFQIKSKLEGHISPISEAKIQFGLMWNSLGALTNSNISHLTKEAQRIAGIYGDCLTVDKPWLEKRFIDIYLGLKEKENNEILINNSNKPKELKTGIKEINSENS